MLDPTALGVSGGLLYCEECGCCSGELGKGWVAYACEDPDGVDEPRIVVYCPPCAASEFGYRPAFAETYVCAWEPLETEAGETSDAS
jgi:hypothetical protein